MPLIRFFDRISNKEISLRHGELEQLSKYQKKPLRQRHIYRGQPIISGFYWFSTISQHVCHESKLGRINFTKFNFSKQAASVIPQQAAVLGNRRRILEHS